MREGIPIQPVSVSNDRPEAVPSGAALLREARTQLYALCEATEDETHHALGLLDRDDETKVHERGFHRGRKSEAKAISRAMGEVFRDLLAKAEDQP